MKHTITINQENTTEHIIHLDQHLPINIKPLPNTIAYQIRNTPILTTTTQTLTNQTIQQIRQKNKTITQPTHLIIIRNTNNTKLQEETIKENPMITIHHTKPNTITKTLNKLLVTLTPPTTKPVTIKNNTLYHNNTPIKTYKNTEYLQLITTILNNKPHLTLQQAEYQAQRQYYQHISYDKTNNYYKLTINNNTSTYTKLIHAIQEKNIQTNKTEPEEETLCQNNNNTTLEPLPPTPWNNQIHNITREHKKYQTRHKTNHNNPDTINIIHQRKTDPTTILNTQKPNRNLILTRYTATIVKKTEQKQQKYYKTNNKTQARYIRDKLEQNHYDKTKIPEYEQQYNYHKKEYPKTYTKKHQTIDYYQNTTTKLYQNNTTKETYQQQKIRKTP